MSDREYEAVLWDIGGVIVDHASIREAHTAFVADLAREGGFDAEEGLERWRSVLGDHFKGSEGTNYRLAREGYRKATAALFEGSPPDDWADRLEAALEERLSPEPGAVETIETLDSAGVRLGIVSDIDIPDARLMLGTFGVYDRFDHVTTSEAVGHTKPDARMFEDALEGLGIDAGDAIMVGDRHSHDVAGAAALGIDAVGYGENARGPKATHEIDDLRRLLEIVGVGE